MRSLIFAIVSVICAAYVYAEIEVRTAITDFLPRDDQSQALDLARELSQSAQTRVVVFTLAASDEAKQLAAARTFAAQLRDSGQFEWVRSGVGSEEQSEFYRLFFPARLGLLELPPGQAAVPDAFFDERVLAMKERLAGPLGVLERRLAPDDPLGAFAGLLSKQAASRGRLRLAGDQLVTADGRYAVLFASTRASAFDGAAQRTVESAIMKAVDQAKTIDPAATLEWSGVNRFAIAGEASVRGDIERISTLSLLGIFVLYLGVFRSFREPLLVLLPIAFGCLLATAVCQLVFGFVHGLALAFGSSIIGVAEDYSTHYFAHRLHAPEAEDNEQLMVRLWPGMWMGGATTIAGISMLSASGFPGLSQMALFGAVGVFGALLATRYVLPAWSRKRPLAARGRLSKVGERLLAGVCEKPARALYCLAPALLAIALGAPHISFEDRVAALRTPNPALEAENQRVQARLGRGAPGRMVVALGANDEQALERAQAVHDALVAARMRGDAIELRSAVELVPPLATQRARVARLREDSTSWPRVCAALERHGFLCDAFEPFRSTLAEEPRLLSIADVAKSPLREWIAPFRATVHGTQVAYLTPVSAGSDVDVARLVANIEGARYIDQDAIFSDAYARFRTRAMAMVAAGLVLVLVTLLARYRALRVAALGLLPALLGAGAAGSIEALRGVPASLMHVIGALLVLSMGVDYGIYALESRQSHDEGVTTLGSVLLAALTNVLSFGLLALSDNPALAAIGSMVGFGMVFTVLASPVVLALSRGESR